MALRDDDIWNTGKDYYRVPLDFLLSRQRAKSLAGKVSNEAKFYPKVGRSVYGEHTTSLSVVDDDVSVTITMTQMYGFERNGLLRGLGFNLNDGACYFSLDPADKERVEPGQRPRFPLSPVVAVSEERTVTMGAAGGWTIPQTVTLTLLKSLRFGAAVNDAVNSPRYLMRYRTNSIPYPPGTEVEVEEGIPSDTINYLRARGHVLARHTPLGGVPSGPSTGWRCAEGGPFQERTGGGRGLALWAELFTRLK
ncbi:hypothetical protein HS1genome_1941 [Sulfodiicoccus acidiphilus]|uniref:Uncharacterized protein n=1 Tax=Sulfodiicoccus acidiphilus TaxID=1670455 RepID=A0A348B5V0_9CREN|nr:gamma-glutamyltransferase [Sulfodiicoccus acidiphilus]BBD73552.1 hypothetical protein HS1genome_1941 [Sulfodiicoccus acidiphilus]